MTGKKLLSILKSGKVAAVPRADWSDIGRDFVPGESHGTGVAGQLLVGTLADHLVAVEEAEPDLLAVRPLASPKAAKILVQQRLDAYDRLWDG